MRLNPELRAEMTEAMTAQLIIADLDWRNKAWESRFTFGLHVAAELHGKHAHHLAEQVMDFIYGKVDDEA